MGYGFLRQSIKRQHQLSSHAYEQHPPAHVKHGKPAVSDAIRLAVQGDGPAEPIRFTTAVPGTPGRVQCTRLATKCGQRV